MCFGSSSRLRFETRCSKTTSSYVKGNRRSVNIEKYKRQRKAENGSGAIVAFDIHSVRPDGTEHRRGRRQQPDLTLKTSVHVVASNSE